MDTKRCPSCKQIKEISEFYKNSARGDGLSPTCRSCHNADTQARSQRLRGQAITQLGGVCAHCGYNDARALQIDHRNGGGRTDRTSLGSQFYKMVIANPGPYQCLCANCNAIKRVEEGEHRPAASYSREVPTERIRKPILPGSEAALARGAKMSQWFKDNPEAAAVRNAKISATRKAKGLRPGQRLGED